MAKTKAMILNVMGQLEDLLQEGGKIFLQIKPKKKRGKEESVVLPVVIIELDPESDHVIVDSLEKSKKRMSISTNTEIVAMVSKFTTRCF
ncbi:MAG TPA: hypothetical protein PLD14_00685 [Candidatus Pacearchaeota archaeon]|nr:hypothetical protein [Candidatus Pacearchaeota archaeon]HPR79723.1 hypothetical protein [Candidatus Pacearchaeota archaeon]